jgi:hypothetical protein
MYPQVFLDIARNIYDNVDFDKILLDLSNDTESYVSFSNFKKFFFDSKVSQKVNIYYVDKFIPFIFNNKHLKKEYSISNFLVNCIQSHGYNKQDEDNWNIIRSFIQSYNDSDIHTFDCYPCSEHEWYYVEE